MPTRPFFSSPCAVLTQRSFGIYSSTIVDGIIGSSAGLTAVLGWNVVINLFYIPGTMIGAMYIDKVGPKRMMIIMLVAQGIVGFGMSGRYVQLQQSIGGFAVVYGIFLSLGEAGPGTSSSPLPPGLS